MDYCKYYQARIKKEDCWFFVAALRSCEHVAFDRTIDKAKSLFEFFVPVDTEKYFLQLMEYFQRCEIATDLTELPNRLKNEELISYKKN